MLKRARPAAALFLAGAAALLGGGAGSLLGLCGPFTDVAADAFCPFVLEIFYLGITTGTTATTYDPSSNVSRLQMAAFLSRTVDGVLRRGSRRAALGKFWMPQTIAAQGVTTVAAAPFHVASDGKDLWVAHFSTGPVLRVRASDGKVLETWTGTFNGAGVLAAMGRIFVTGDTNPGFLFGLDPSQPAGAVTILSSVVGSGAFGLTFDGARVWVASQGLGTPGIVAIVTPGPSVPWTTTTVTIGTDLVGALYDGSNVWVTDYAEGKLRKLDAAGAVLQTVTTQDGSRFPVFDGSNIWVPNSTVNSVSVVRASTGVVLATLTGNGLGNPATVAFDGERILVSNGTPGGVSLFKAADLTALGSVATEADAFGACSDGINFWVTIANGKLIRF